MVLLLPRVRERPELRGERLQRVETRSRNTHPYRSPVCRDDGSYFVRLFVAWMVDPEQGKLGRWKKSRRRSQTRRPEQFR
jgi:hypothetical protein